MQLYAPLSLLYRMEITVLRGTLCLWSFSASPCCSSPVTLSRMPGFQKKILSVDECLRMYIDRQTDGES